MVARLTAPYGFPSLPILCWRLTSSAQVSLKGNDIQADRHHPKYKMRGFTPKISQVRDKSSQKSLDAEAKTHYTGSGEVASAPQ
jgi:hypothetical protein